MLASSSDPITVLGIDVGDARIGIARANSIAKLPEPLTILAKTDEAINEIYKVAKNNSAELFVIGLPLTSSGIDSEQTKKVRTFAAALHSATGMPCVFVDETYSSQQADTTITEQGAKQTSNDAIAACIILERYFSEGVVGSV